MAIQDIVNPGLYNAIRKYVRSKFQDDPRVIAEPVKITDRGQLPALGYRYDTLSQRRIVVFRGPHQHFNIPCPHCYRISHKKSYRCSISCMFGEPDPTDQSKHLLHLINCFNDTDCFRSFESRLEFYRELFLPEYMSASVPTIGHNHPIVEMVDEQVDLPEHCANIAELSSSNQAVKYLSGRGFDVKKLGKMFGVRVNIACDERWPWIVGRIIIPSYVHNKLTLWQARYPYDVDWKSTGILRYFTNGKRRMSLLNYDDCTRQSIEYLYVVEGPTSLWATYDNIDNQNSAVCALFGYKLCNEQVQLLKNLRKNNNKLKIIFMIDPREVDKFLFDGSSSRIKIFNYNIEELIREFSADDMAVVKLPIEHDPCSLAMSNRGELVRLMCNPISILDCKASAEEWLCSTSRC